MPHLNSDLLRTFLAINAAGSVTGGAERIGRSQSAASLQIRQLEALVGKPLFDRHGRGVVLTAAGETLLPVATNVVRALDRTLGELRGEGLEGVLRIGMPEEHGRTKLAGIIADFSARHPRVELEVLCARGTGFQDALASGLLDLAVFEVARPEPDQIVLQTYDMVWLARADLDLPADRPVPVALFDRTCWWRDLALTSLDAAGRKYRVVFTSENAVGVRAAVQSGIAAGLLHGTDSLSKDLTRVPGLETPHASYLVLQRGPRQQGAACDAMADTVRRAFDMPHG